MKNPAKSQVAEGREYRPSSSTTFSATWSRVLGLALLALSAVSSNAASRQVLDGAVTDGEGNTRSHKFSADLQARATNDMVTVVVQYRQMPASSSFKSMQAAGGTIKFTHQAISAVTMRVPASMLADLANDPNVAYISPDRPLKSTAATTEIGENDAAAGAVEAYMAEQQFPLDGTGIGIAVIDSGISDHADLHGSKGNSRVVYSQSFVLGDQTTADQFGHGTHVAGLLAGNGSSSGPNSGYQTTYQGMASNVNLINLRVLDKYGVGTDSGVIAAIQQAIALKRTYNIRVINMSLGRPVFESYTLDPVCKAVEAAWKAGIVVVVAAGNDGRNNLLGTDGYGTIGVPANDPAVITVGATDTLYTTTRVDDTIASYSSKGPSLIDHIVKPDLVAPGNRLVSLRANGSTLDKLHPQFDVAPSNGVAKYFLLSGTSMATPVVSGAAALMLQNNSALTPDQVKARLMKTAWKGFGQFSRSSDTQGNVYANEYDIFTYGAGYLDLDAALNNTDLATGLALSPTAVYNSRTGQVTIANTSSAAFGGTSVVWGATSVVWGDSVVWGATAIVSNSVVWGATSVVWGSTSVSGFSVVWGATCTALNPMGSLSSGDDGDN
jgi:serine protease AprX